MKKPTSKTSRRQKLALRAEAIALLTPPQLAKVGGGWTWEWPCGGASQAEQFCEGDMDV
jgi:hypothetical protein